MSTASLAFSLIPSDIAQFVPRLGTLSLQRRDGLPLTIEVKTPGVITTTSRGMVPHLSRDHVKCTKSIQWANIPFESFLDRVPPVPTLQGGSAPLHSFLGYDRGHHLLSMTARDPLDGRDMPPNGKDYVSAFCIRGVRKLTPASWKSFFEACNPDVIVALSDNPNTQIPPSQKRLQKSLERTTAWLSHLLSSNTSTLDAPIERPNVIVNLVGGIDVRARRTFSENLMEVLHGKEQEHVHPLYTLDEGVTGYQLELLPMRTALRAEQVAGFFQDEIAIISDLMRASFDPLPTMKPRIAYGAQSPHEILCFIRDVGLDLFDSRWSQRAADIGIALDFRFPVPDASYTPSLRPASSPKLRNNSTRDIGHNLFDLNYAHDHSRLASSFLDGASCTEVSLGKSTADLHWCACGACTPSSPPATLIHDQIGQPPQVPASILPPYTRSYIHHLLHTHEMSSHTLLVMHNLSVVDAFFAGIRQIIHRSQTEPELFSREVERFMTTYEHPRELFTEAERDWAKVESERGKGRLAREKQRQEAEREVRKEEESQD